jgi:acetoin:2,6-dichlorophenolindophenol oxidoreductase subunit beta
MTATATTTETRTLSYVEALNLALDEALERDERVFILGEDISDRTGGGFKVTRGLTNKYGTERVRDTPIAEQAIIGAAIGAALGGMRPVAEIMVMDFIAVAMDQIANHAAKLRYMSGGRTGVPMTIRTAVSGGIGFGAQHSQSLEGWFAQIPGIKVVAPATPADAKGLLTACIEDDDPCLVLEGIGLYFTAKGPVPVGHHTVPIGKADIKRPGEHVSVITYGQMLPRALAAAETLSGQGIEVEVVDLRSLVPLDLGTVLGSATKTRRAIVAHTATKAYGPGAELAATIAQELFGTLEAPVLRLGAKYAPNPYARNLETALYPQVDDIVEAVKIITS